MKKIWLVSYGGCGWLVLALTAERALMILRDIILNDDDEEEDDFEDCVTIVSMQDAISSVQSGKTYCEIIDFDSLPLNDNT